MTVRQVPIDCDVDKSNCKVLHAVEYDWADPRV